MAGAGAGGNTPPHQDKAGFFSSSQPFTFNEEHLAAKVEEERRVTEWREAEGREGAHNLLWTQFQQTAAALTQLYRQEAGQGREGEAGGGEGEGGGGGGGGREWQPFQVAAGHLTMLYRESLEEMRKASEAARKSGHQRARADLVTWIRGRRGGRNISRAELLTWLAREQELDSRQGEERLALPPVSDPATQHALLQMFESSRLGEEDRDQVLGGGRKRGGGGGNNEEEMESPQSKRTRFL